MRLNRFQRVFLDLALNEEVSVVNVPTFHAMPVSRRVCVVVRPLTRRSFPDGVTMSWTGVRHRIEQTLEGHPMHIGMKLVLVHLQVRLVLIIHECDEGAVYAAEKTSLTLFGSESRFESPPVAFSPLWYHLDQVRDELSLAGRERELEQLRGFLFAPAREQDLLSVALVGPPGFGRKFFAESVFKLLGVSPVVAQPLSHDAFVLEHALPRTGTLLKLRLIVCSEEPSSSSSSCDHVIHIGAFSASQRTDVLRTLAPQLPAAELAEESEFFSVRELKTVIELCQEQQPLLDPCKWSSL